MKAILFFILILLFLGARAQFDSSVVALFTISHDSCQKITISDTLTNVTFIYADSSGQVMKKRFPVVIRQYDAEKCKWAVRLWAMWDRNERWLVNGKPLDVIAVIPKK